MTDEIKDQDSVPAPAKRRVQDRRCVGTGEALAPDAPALRFVLGPGDTLTLDLKGTLPGRGAWLSATHDALLTALKKGGFQRGFKTQANLPGGMDPESFADHVEERLAQAALDRLGLARKAGYLLIGHDTVREKASKGAAYVTPSDASAPEIAKVANYLDATAKLPHFPLPVPRAVLGEAVGQDGVHYLLCRGGPSKGALTALILWTGFRG